MFGYVRSISRLGIHVVAIETVLTNLLHAIVGAMDIKLVKILEKKLVVKQRYEYNIKSETIVIVIQKVFIDACMYYL